MSKTDRMPVSERIGIQRAFDVHHLLYTYEKWLKGDETYPSGAKRRVMGIGLPDWQRPLRWSDQQCIRFIESIWRGISIGFWMLNVVDTREPSPLDGLVIDGQQRLTALQRYVDNEFTVAAADDTPLYWRDLTVFEKRRFGRTPFPFIELSVTDENKLKELYVMHNFSGTPHTEEDLSLVSYPMT